MSRFLTEKYHIENVDCANCAAKIESGLQKMESVEFASLDFANQRLHIRATDLRQVIDRVHQIEPDVVLTPSRQLAAATPTDTSRKGYPFRREAVVLGIAGGLFLAVLLGEDWLRHQPWPLGALIVAAAYLLAGWNVLWGALRTIRRGTFFDENVLMVIATAGAMAIHAYAEAIGVMIFYKVGEMLQELAVNRSRRSIRALLDAKPDVAVLKTFGGLKEVAPETVAVSDHILVKPGQKIPLDGVVIDGSSQIDTSVLTGESRPLSKSVGDTVMAGQIAQTGALTIEVTRLFNESSISKIMDLVENATARKAKTEKFITTFARYYTPAVVVLAALIAVGPPLVSGAAFETWFYRALVMLVISCPCALVVSIPLGYFGGIGRASRSGILVKGSNFIDVLANLNTVVFDKTGTLTEGVFEVKSVVNLNGFSKARVLEFAAAAELQSTHPIASSIVTAYSRSGGRIDATKVGDHTDFAGKGVTARYQGHTVLVGNDRFLHLNEVTHDRCAFDSTVAHVAVDGHYVGYVLIGDRLKSGAVQAVRALKAHGVSTVAMLTGDNQRAAAMVAERLELDTFQAELLPEEKVTAFETLSRCGKKDGKTAYVGDGINDAPVIARADVGVAMGALGSDAAVETADVVLMADTPLKMVQAVVIAKQTRRIVWQNIILAFLVKGIFLTFGAFGMASMWEAVFADMGTALVAVINSTRILKIGRVEANE